MTENLARVLQDRGYILWSRQYADSYDLRRDGAGTVRVVLWHGSAEETRRADIFIFDKEEHGGSIEVKCNPATRDRLPFLLALLDAAEAQVSRPDVVPAEERA